MINRKNHKINTKICYNTDMNRIKKILAIICVVLLVGLYVATFILSLFDSPKTTVMFRGCIICTIFVPLVAYVFMCLHRYAMYRSGRRDDYASSNDNAQSDDK